MADLYRACEPQPGRAKTNLLTLDGAVAKAKAKDAADPGILSDIMQGCLLAGLDDAARAAIHILQAKASDYG